jgi:hypothetical protein
MTNDLDAKARRKKYRATVHKSWRIKPGSTKSNPVELWAAPEAAGFTPGHVSKDGYISTAEALTEFWEKDDAPGQRLDPAAFDQFQTDISAALRKRVLVPIAQKDGETKELDAKWAKPSGLDSLWDGVVGHVGLSSLYMWMAGAPIYFRRTEWERWIASWVKRLENKEADAQSDVELDVAADAWLRREMLQRAKAGETRLKPAMVIALKVEFPSLKERRARKLIEALPKELRARRGPAKGPRRISVQK